MLERGGVGSKEATRLRIRQVTSPTTCAGPPKAGTWPTGEGNGPTKPRWRDGKKGCLSVSMAADWAVQRIPGWKGAVLWATEKGLSWENVGSNGARIGAYQPRLGSGKGRASRITTEGQLRLEVSDGRVLLKQLLPRRPKTSVVT